MTSWIKPGALLDQVYVSTATPLAKGSTLIVSNWQLFWGGVGGSIGETSAFAILLGAAWLFKKGILDWKIPGSFLATVFILAILGGQDPLFHLLSGGTMLGAFFMMTDYVTSPMTKMGRLLYGISLGILVMCVRYFSNMPEGLAFCVVFMNGTVPLLDRLGVWLHIRVYGIIFKDQQEST
jgi:electron transport complex protein RnfD